MTADNCCPQCGDRLPIVRDAFCVTCGEALDEPPKCPRTPEEQRAFRARVEAESKQSIHLILRLLHLFGR